MFSLLAKLTALAIVHIFEASKPFGAYDAFVVLPDGAGVSYGISQFTHRSGSLLAVIKEYLKRGGKVGSDYFNEILPVLKQKTEGAITQLARDKKFKHFLQLAAETDEMKAAQIDVLTEKYLQPAIDACEGSRFVLPMSLAVVYDSMNQGSFALIRDRVRIAKGQYKNDLDYEKAWITQYVRNRDSWLENHPKKILQSTDYRTDFFLAQIARQNWQLKTPMNVHGHKLTAEILAVNDDFFDSTNSASDLENSPKPITAARDDFSSDDQSNAADENLFTEGERPADDQTQGSGAQVVINNNPPAADPNQSQANNASTDPAPPPPIKDETVIVEQVKPDESVFQGLTEKAEALQTTFKARWLAIPSGILGFFSAIWAFIENANPIIVAALIIGVVAIIGGFVCGVIYLKNRDRQRISDAAARDHEAKMQAAKFAHELNLVAAKSAIDPGSQTIKFVSDNSQNKK